MQGGAVKKIFPNRVLWILPKNTLSIGLVFDMRVLVSEDPHPPFLGNNSICICAGCALVGFGVGLLVTWNSLHRAISWNLQCAICNIMQDGRISQYWAANMLTVQMQLQGFGWNCKWELGIWKYCKSEQSVFADGAADAAQYGWGGLLVTCPACCQMALTHFT